MTTDPPTDPPRDDTPRRARRTETLLVTVSGKDRPGVTSTLLSTLAHAGVEVIDVEQIVLDRKSVV